MSIGGRRVVGVLLASLLTAPLPALAAGQGSGSSGRLSRNEPSSSPGDHASRVTLHGEWIVVDGEPFLVKGVGYSPYRPGQRPKRDAVSLEVMADDFERIRAAGFNTIRTWAPFTREQLALAREHDLMVLQGVWIDQHGDYGSNVFQDLMRQVVRREAERAKPSDAVLALIVGNELLPEHVYQIGMAQTETLLRVAAQAVKAVDPSRLVSYANWPQLTEVDHSMWDVVSFNVYPYRPASVANSFGFRGYLEHLKRSVGRDKPFIVTELGLSVSPTPGALAGYGGHTPEAQAREVLTLWDDVFQARTQGACVFEWNDEWWKEGAQAGDEQTHDERDPEEWFGLNEFTASDQTHATPRPVYEALSAYNQAVVVSPVDDEHDEHSVPVSLYATPRVASVRLRLEAGSWQAATQVSPHWWKATLPLPATGPVARSFAVTVEARDAPGAVLVTRRRRVWTGPPPPPVSVSIHLDRDRYEVTDQLQSMPFVIRVEDENHLPLANQPVEFSITELPAQTELKQSARTDSQGRITGNYLLREPAVVTISAGSAPDPSRPTRRVGAERVVVVTKREEPIRRPSHRMSAWEARATDDIQRALQHAQPAFQLADPGTEAVVDYNRYGVFHDIGTPAYRYELTNVDGLRRAVGEGIYPNEEGLWHDPAYRKALEDKRLDGDIWEFVAHPEAQLDFFKWAGTLEQPGGVKQFYVAQALERAGLVASAVKAYDAILVHFPEAVGWTEFQTPWYVGPTALDKLEALLRLHPELGLRLEGARIVVQNGFDNDVTNDGIIASPGQLVAVDPTDVSPPTQDLSTLEAVREVGAGRVRLRQYANRHWQLLVDGAPWAIRGISYQPSAVGESPDEGTLKDWMTADRNHNGKPDGPFDTFVDANRNNQQDPEEPTVGDFHLFKEMGINTLRLYHHASNPALLRQLYEQDGVMVLMGDLVGMYTVGSGAAWEEGTDYLNKVQRKRMTESVKQMVREFKHEPYILMWVLGNENNYGGVHGIVGGVGNAAKYPTEYYAFLNELASWIHKEDPDHPVAIANGEVLFLDVIAKHLPAIDVFGANVYRGGHGFGRSFYAAVRDVLDKPVMITEFGCPAYQAHQPEDVGELGQALYHFGSWVDLEDNMAGRGIGNALGGVVFAWVDEWWKAGQPPRFSPLIHETTANWSGPFPGGKNYEEWFGLTSQGEGRHSPYLRQIRKSYRLYQRLWTHTDKES